MFLLTTDTKDDRDGDSRAGGPLYQLKSAIPQCFCSNDLGKLIIYIQALCGRERGTEITKITKQAQNTGKRCS